MSVIFKIQSLNLVYEYKITFEFVCSCFGIRKSYFVFEILVLNVGIKSLPLQNNLLELCVRMEEYTNVICNKKVINVWFSGIH